MRSFRRSDTTPLRRTKRQGTPILWAVALAGVSMAACDSAPPEEPMLTESSALTAAPDPALVRAQSEIATRVARLDHIKTLKSQLTTVAADDTASRTRLLDQIATEQAAHVASIPGLAPPVPGAKGAPAPVYRADVYQRLLTKMSAYDMKKPADVAAWLAVKTKELDQ